jgi:hypothetical protein
MTDQSKIPKLEPIKVKQFESKQSKYDQVGKLPLREIILGRSRSGKGILLQNLILDVYKNCFERIYIWSPSIDIDQTWRPVKKYIESELKVNVEKEKCYFNEYNPEDLEKVISQQHKIADYQKKQDHSKIYQILIIVDDFADDPSFTRHSKLLHSLFTRGRHSFINSIVTTQKFRAINNIIRINATGLVVFKLRSQADLDAFIDEVSAVTDKKTLLEMYHMATHEPFSFLYVKLTSKDPNKLFMIKFHQYLQIE